MFSDTYCHICAHSCANSCAHICARTLAVCRWILYGEIHDSHGEFFVGVVSEIVNTYSSIAHAGNRGSGGGYGRYGGGNDVGKYSGGGVKSLWSEAYYLRHDMVRTRVTLQD